MASRPIFLPADGNHPGAKEIFLDFEWSPGLSASQKKKNVISLHAAASAAGFGPVLEVSSKSEVPLGVALSAFNLSVRTKKTGVPISVESAFQGSKVFERGGPFKDLLRMSSRDAKREERLRSSGNIVCFEFFGKRFPSEPKTYFYDWLYIKTLYENPDLASESLHFGAFSDIEFNPLRSINCQARSAALFVSLSQHGVIEKALKSPEDFLDVLLNHYRSANQSHMVQLRAF